MPRELDILLRDKLLLKADLYKCPICGRLTASASTGNPIGINYCIDDKVGLEHIGTAFVPSKETYEAWNVWMEEYCRVIFEKFPIRYLETGVMLKPKDVEFIASSEEVDAVIVFKGKSIAVECTEAIILSEKKNDIDDLIKKNENLNLFNYIILLYKQVDNANVFLAETKKNEKTLIPVLVGSPKNMKSAIMQALLSIESNKC